MRLPRVKHIVIMRWGSSLSCDFIIWIMYFRTSSAPLHVTHIKMMCSWAQGECSLNSSCALWINPICCSDDGRIILHDSRESNRMSGAQRTIQNTSECTDIKYHPMSEHLFATSDNNGRVCLRDARNAFGPLVNRTREGIVQKVSGATVYFSCCLWEHIVHYEAF